MSDITGAPTRSTPVGSADSSVRAVVFDLGGVLMPTAFDGLIAYERELGLPDSALQNFLRGDLVFQRWQVGDGTPEEFFDHVRASIDAQYGVVIEMERLARAVEEGSYMSPDMNQLLHDLHGSYGIGLCTNTVRESVSWRENIPAELFDVFVDSSHVGIAKPDPAIYELLLEQFGCAGADMVFVDDWEENLVPAAALGMHTILFDNPAQCRQSLESLCPGL